MGLSAFNRMRANRLAEEEARKAEAELASKSVEKTVEKPKRKKTDAEKLKGNKE